MGSAYVLKIKMTRNRGFAFTSSKEDHWIEALLVVKRTVFPSSNRNFFYLLEQLFFCWINPFRNSWVNTEENKYKGFTSVEELTTEQL